MAFTVILLIAAGFAALYMRQTQPAPQVSDQIRYGNGQPAAAQPPINVNVTVPTPPVQAEFHWKTVTVDEEPAESEQKQPPKPSDQAPQQAPAKQGTVGSNAPVPQQTIVVVERSSPAFESGSGWYYDGYDQSCYLPVLSFHASIGGHRSVRYQYLDTDPLHGYTQLRAHQSPPPGWSDDFRGHANGAFKPSPPITRIFNKPCKSP